MKEDRKRIRAKEQRDIGKVEEFSLPLIIAAGLEKGKSNGLRKFTSLVNEYGDIHDLKFQSKKKENRVYIHIVPGKIDLLLTALIISKFFFVKEIIDNRALHQVNIPGQKQTICINIKL